MEQHALFISGIMIPSSRDLESSKGTQAKVKAAPQRREDMGDKKK